MSVNMKAMWSHVAREKGKLDVIVNVSSHKLHAEGYILNARESRERNQLDIVSKLSTHNHIMAMYRIIACAPHHLNVPLASPSLRLPTTRELHLMT